jgi:hypothetical protein
MKARGDHLYEGGGEEPHGINIRLQGEISRVAHVDAGVSDMPTRRRRRKRAGGGGRSNERAARRALEPVPSAGIPRQNREKSMSVVPGVR